MPCKTLVILLAGLAYKKDNGYSGVIIDVSGVIDPKTQLNDALIESYAVKSETGGSMWTGAGLRISFTG